VYGAQQVEALLPGGDLWDSTGRILGGEAGDWYSGPLGMPLAGLWAAEAPPETESPGSGKGVPQKTQPPKKKPPKDPPKTDPPKEKKDIPGPEDRAVTIPGDGTSLNEDELAKWIVEATEEIAPKGAKQLIEAIKGIGRLLPKDDADNRCSTCCKQMCGHDPVESIGSNRPVKCKGGPRIEAAKTSGQPHRCYCDKNGNVWAETRSSGLFLQCRCGGFKEGNYGDTRAGMLKWGVVDRVQEKDEKGKKTGKVTVRVIYIPKPDEKK